MFVNHLTFIYIFLMFLSNPGSAQRFFKNMELEQSGENYSRL